MWGQKLTFYSLFTTTYFQWGWKGWWDLPQQSADEAGTHARQVDSGSQSTHTIYSHHIRIIRNISGRKGAFKKLSMDKRWSQIHLLHKPNHIRTCSNLNVTVFSNVPKCSVLHVWDKLFSELKRFFARGEWPKLDKVSERALNAAVAVISLEVTPTLY